MTGIEQRVANRFLEVTAAKGVSRVHSDDPLTEEALQWLIEEREKVIAQYSGKIQDLKKKIVVLEYERGTKLEVLRADGVKKFPQASWTDVMRLLARDSNLKGRS